MFKKFNNSMINPDFKENQDIIKIKYENFESLIRCYASVIHYQNYDLTFESDFFMRELL